MLEQMRVKASGRHKAVRELMRRLRKLSPQETDRHFHALHLQEFRKIDCLECANCCSTLSPAITDYDVQRISRFLKVKPSSLIESHLELDEEGDYVFRNLPCPFLLPDKYCSIYEARPRACREYPHTDRNKIHQILDLTACNYSSCPAVFNILENLMNPAWAANLRAWY